MQQYEFTQQHMGTSFRLVFYAKDSTMAYHAADQAFTRIAYLNQLLSDYLADSEISRLSNKAGNGSATPVSDELWQVLNFAQLIAEASGGAFDVSIGALTKLWRKAFRQATFPDEKEIDQAKTTVGYQYITLYPAIQSVALTKEGMRLDLGGIAKGYAVDEAMKALAQQGITHALVDGGGDLSLKSDPTIGQKWKIRIENGKVYELANCAIATSGNQYKFLENKGKRYSHLIDPRTGMGVTHQRQITVIADNCMNADALASACSILSSVKAKQLARKMDAKLYILTKK
jgi:thiamine biosynthesis lipoprotein